MMKVYFFLLQFIICGLLFSAVQPPHGFEMGVAPEAISKEMKDVSNKESWEETRFVPPSPATVFGVNAIKSELAFWKNRLYRVELTLPLDSWLVVKDSLNKIYGPAWSLDTTSAEKSGSWGETKNGVSVFQLNSTGTVVVFADEEQKAFRFSDLFQGVLLYIIIAIAGLLVLNLLLGWLVTSRCKKCGSFAMKYQQVELSGLKDQSSELLTTSMHHDVTYAFKCSKCGHSRKDKYSGFWSYIRSKE